MRAYILTVLFIILFCSVASSQERINTEIFFSEAERKAVLKGRILSRAYLKYRGTISSDADPLIKVPLSGYIPQDMNLYDMLCIEKAFFPFDMTNKSGVEFCSSLNAASKFKSMLYYSRTGKKVLPFVSSCFSVDGDSHVKRVNDVVFKEIPQSAESYFRITDNRFGSLLFKNEFYYTGGNFILKNICIQQVNYGFIAICGPEQYQTIYFFIYDEDKKGFFFCSLCGMKIQSTLFLRLSNVTAESFANRLRAGTVYMAGLLGLDWKDKLKAFE